MKYLMEWWPREPIEENMKKIYVIEAERHKKGVAITEGVSPIYFTLSDPHGIWIIEDDVKMSKISKYVKDYSNVAKIMITPLLTRDEMEKL